MSLQVKLALQGNLEKFTKDVQARLTFATRAAVETYAKRLQLSLREDAREGGLGDKVANAWRLNVYPNDGNPAALVYSKAPLIVTAFSGDTTITPHDGHLWLAIPTDNVPRIGNKRMTPSDVESRFNQDLIFVPTRPGTSLAFVNVIAAKSGHGFRPPTKGRRTSQGRATQLVLMFIMVQQVRLQKRLDWPHLMAEARAGFQEFFTHTINDALKD